MKQKLSRITPEAMEVFEKKLEELREMHRMFHSIWEKRPHESEVSGTPIYGEALTTYFHHILPKEESQYPEAKLDESNIIILTEQEHHNVEMDMYRYEEINKRREELLLTYNK